MFHGDDDDTYGVGAECYLDAGGEEDEKNLHGDYRYFLMIMMVVVVVKRTIQKKAKMRQCR
jgi:hypothetical protein